MLDRWVEDGLLGLLDQEGVGCICFSPLAQGADGQIPSRYPKVPGLALLLESFWCYQLLATRSLKDESMRVYDRLKYGTLEEARKAVIHDRRP